MLNLKRKSKIGSDLLFVLPCLLSCGSGPQYDYSSVHPVSNHPNFGYKLLIIVMLFCSMLEINDVVLYCV